VRNGHHELVIGVSGAAPRVNGAAAAFRVPDPACRLADVRLRPDVRVAGPLDFRRHGDGWDLVIVPPPVDRMEYLVELCYPDGRRETVTDPGNRRQVAGVFGPKSVLELPGYVPPGWLTAPAAAGTSHGFELPVRSLDGVLAVRTWSPEGVRDDEALPLLLVHDGPEYDTLASLTRYLSAGVAGGWLPRLRAALLSPGPRDRWYSANARYARALRHAVIPALAGRLAVSLRVGMGASLGGLAMLHAYCRYPDAFDALFLQSGSFFSPRFDSHERRFPYYRRVTGFVAGVQGAPGLGGAAHGSVLPARPASPAPGARPARPAPPAPAARPARPALPARTVPVVLTCGVVEENLENNRLMTQALRARGYPAALHEVPDAHNYTAWRDALDPHLTRLLRQMRA
jgi:enterochelin esterase-like enzyme